MAVLSHSLVSSRFLKEPSNKSHPRDWRFGQEQILHRSFVMYAINRAIASRRMMQEMGHSPTGPNSRRASVSERLCLNVIGRSNSFIEDRGHLGGHSAEFRTDDQGHLTSYSVKSPATMRRSSTAPIDNREERKKSVKSEKPINSDNQQSNIAMSDQPKLQLCLTKAQRQQIKQSWKKITTAAMSTGLGAVTVLSRVFERMLIERPKVKNIFFKAAFVSAMGRGREDEEKTLPMTTIREHAKLLVVFIDKIVNSLDSANRIEDPSEYGMKHSCLKRFGLRSADWDLFGETLSEVIITQDSVRGLPDAAKGWMILIAVVTDKLRVGFQKRSRSFAEFTHSQPQSTVNANPPSKLSRDLSLPLNSIHQPEAQPNMQDQHYSRPVARSRAYASNYEMQQSAMRYREEDGMEERRMRRSRSAAESRSWQLGPDRYTGIGIGTGRYQWYRYRYRYR